MDEDVIRRLELMAAKGLVVSIACGPYSGTQQYNDVPGAEAGDLLYSVDILWPGGEMFRKPYACETFAEAVTIAAAEVAAWEGLENDE